jgi:hypothetical protein
VKIGRKRMVFSNEPNERAERVKGVQGVRDDIGGISLEWMLDGFEIFLNFLNISRSR